MTAQDQERSRRERMREHGQIMFGLARGDIRYETVIGAMPALIACLFTGIAIGHPELGMIAAGGALSVGFGAFQNFTIHRAAPMAFALLGMLVATFLGSLAGGSVILLVLLGGIFTALCAASNVAGPGAWWITLQWTIAVYVAGAFPADLAFATERTAIVLLGGLLQIVIVTAVWHFYPRPPFDRAQRESERWQHLFTLMVHSLADRREVLGYTAAVTATVMFASVLGLLLPIHHGYWVPVTALIVLRPRAQLSIQRIIYRIIGTMVGAGAATLLAALLRPHEYVLAITVVILVGLAYSLQRSGYAVFTAAVTAAIAFLSTLAGLPELDVVRDRVFANLLGGGLALVTALGFLLLERRNQPPQ
jgi:uncharacterized membrane protein YccC